MNDPENRNNLTSGERPARPGRNNGGTGGGPWFASRSCLCLGLLVVLALPACRQGGRPALRDYLPAHQGDTWWFEGEPGIIQVESVTPAGKYQQIRVTWRRADGSVYRKQDLERRENGVIYALTTGPEGRVALDHPQCVSPPGYRAGSAILSELTSGVPAGTPRRFDREWAVVGTETVETPAGRFHGCLHMQESLRDLSKNPLPERVTDTWFAPGVGWVGYHERARGEEGPGASRGRFMGARVGGRVFGKVPRRSAGQDPVP